MNASGTDDPCDGPKIDPPGGNREECRDFNDVSRQNQKENQDIE